MTLIHRIIIMHKKAILLGRKRQRKEDYVMAEEMKKNHDLIIKNMIDSNVKETERLKENHDKILKNMINSQEKEIEKINENHQLEIKRLQNQNKIEVSAIRNQVQHHYEPLLRERNEEIARLNEEKIEQKKYYKNILDYGIAMETSGERAAGMFTRAQSKVKDAMELAMACTSVFTDAMKLVDRGNACVESIQMTVGKTTPRLLRKIKE
jgi:hypothetical protein